VVGLDAALLHSQGTIEGPFSPAVYVVVALVASFARPLAGLAVVVWVILVEAAIRRFTLGEPGYDALATHAAFALAFALLNWAFLRTEVARIRVTARARVEDELRRLREDARRYRLLASSDGAPGQQARGTRERIERSSVEEIHQSVHYALDLLRRTQGLHTAILLWLNDAGTHLCISELSTSSDEIHDAPFSVSDGVLAAVVLRKERVSLADVRPSFHVPYYDGPCPVGALAAIPVVEEQTLRGILVIDKTASEPFTPHQEELAAQAARFCLRAIQNERVFVQLERAKVEQGKLYRAAQALAAAPDEHAVLEAGVRAAREIASFDLAAVTIYDPKTRVHEVACTTSAQGEIDDLAGAHFTHNTGLVSMVVENRFPLPYKGEFDPAHQVVLARRLTWPKFPSLLVLPLVLHDRALGTLILGARRRHAFGEAVRPTLEVLASHLAVSLSNARMVHKLETMATTDGLTGLHNKRAMLDAAEQKVAAAARFERALSVIVIDLDHFKRVNDTYGHDVGDLVIKGLGEILKKNKRATDVVARFGGEEFVVLCEETNEAGALLLAERVREELKKTVFHVKDGHAATPATGKKPGVETTLQITCSLGIATFPEAGTDWDALFKAADEALYASKRGGRDRVTAWRGRVAKAREAAALRA
jgi:diguanylate cyclase (GGDEF)-like protein